MDTDESVELIPTIDWGALPSEETATVTIESNDPDEPSVNVFVTAVPVVSPDWDVVFYTNSTTGYGTVTIGDESTPASEEDFVGAFVGEECRAVGHPVISDGQAYVTLVIQGEEVDEVEFRVFDTSECAVLDNGRATTNPGGAIGYPPDYLQICAGCYVHQDVELNAGWNLMSLYVHPDDMSPESIFGPVTCLLQVKNMTQSYDPALPSFLNTLTALEDGNGYFVNMGCAETLSLDAALVDGSFVVINLNSGWNLIGYPFRTGQAVEDAFATLIGAGKLVQVKSMTQSYDPLLPPFLNTLATLEPGQGYLINLNASDSFTYPAASLSATVKSGTAKEEDRPWEAVMLTQSMVQYGNVTLNENRWRKVLTWVRLPATNAAGRARLRSKKTPAMPHWLSIPKNQRR